VKATYTFTSRLYVRGIVQYVDTDRERALYLSSVDAHSGDLSGSLLFAYKVNWQSVMYVGYGDNRELTENVSLPGQSPGGRHLAPLDRQLFVKVSYAFQR